MVCRIPPENRNRSVDSPAKEAPMSDKRSLIRRFFSDLPEEDFYILYNAAQMERIDAGGRFTPPDTEAFCTRILEGSVAVEKKTTEGLELRVLYSRGKWFRGDDTPMGSIATCLENTTLFTIRQPAVSALPRHLQGYLSGVCHQVAEERISLLESETARMAKILGRIGEKKQSELAELRMDYTTSPLILALIEKVPRLPVFIDTLATSIEENRVTTQAVADMVRADPSLTGRILKTVNSAYYGLSFRVEDVHKAILFLGFNRLHQMVLDDALKHVMPDDPSFREVHHRSVAISYLGACIAEVSGKSHPTRVATAGLLQSLGLVIRHLLSQQNAKLSLLINALDTDVLGALLLEEWKMAEVQVETVLWQSAPQWMDPLQLPETIRETVSVLYLANVCFEYMAYGQDMVRQGGFANAYGRYVGVQGGSMPEAIRKELLPTLVKNLDATPAFFRELVKRFTRPKSKTGS